MSKHTVHSETIINDKDDPYTNTKICPRYTDYITQSHNYISLVEGLGSHWHPAL